MTTFTDPARNLLQSLRDFGWPVLAYAVFAPIATYMFPSNLSRQERTARLLLVGAIIAIIEAFFFTGTEINDFIQITRLHPAWGYYVVLLMLIALGSAARWTIRRGRENRKAITLIGSGGEVDDAPTKNHASSCITVAVIWIAGALAAIIWLNRITNSQ